MEVDFTRDHAMYAVIFGIFSAVWFAIALEKTAQIMEENYICRHRNWASLGDSWWCTDVLLSQRAFRAWIR